MQNLKTKTLILILSGVMVVGGLGYGGYRFARKQISGSTDNQTIQVNSYPFTPFDEIQLPDSIPQFTNSTMAKKLAGKNSDGQDLYYFDFNLSASLTNMNEVSQFYLTELSQNQWNIKSKKANNCIQEEEPCNEWYKIIADKDSQTIELFIFSHVSYEITLSSGGQIPVLLNIPDDFPSELIPADVSIKTFLRGYDDQKSQVTLLELTDFSSDELKKFLPSLQEKGWRENCGCASSPGFSNCGCSKENMSYMFNFRSGEFYDKDKTTLEVKEK